MSIVLNLREDLKRGLSFKELDDNFKNLRTAIETTLPNEYFKQGGNDFGTTAILGTTGSTDLNIITSGITRMVIDDQGYIGVNDNPTLGNFRLNVNGTAKFSDVLTVISNSSPTTTFINSSTFSLYGKNSTGDSGIGLNLYFDNGWYHTSTSAYGGAGNATLFSTGFTDFVFATGGTNPATIQRILRLKPNAVLIGTTGDTGELLQVSGDTTLNLNDLKKFNVDPIADLSVLSGETHSAGRLVTILDGGGIYADNTLLLSDGSIWKEISLSGFDTLAELTDTNISTGITDGDILVYFSGDTKWNNYSLTNNGSSADNVLVLDSNNRIKYRTNSEFLSDIGLDVIYWSGLTGVPNVTYTVTNTGTTANFNPSGVTLGNNVNLNIPILASGITGTTGLLTYTDWNIFNNKLDETTGWKQGGNSFGSTGILGTNDNYDLLLRTNNINRVRIKNDGNILIGDTGATQTHNFQVSGSGLFKDLLTVTSSTQDYTRITAGNNNINLFGNPINGISGVGGNLYYNTDWTHNNITGFSGNGNALQFSGNTFNFVFASGGTSPATTFTPYSFYNDGRMVMNKQWQLGSLTTYAGNILINNTNVIDFFTSYNIGIGTNGIDPTSNKLYINNTQNQRGLTVVNGGIFIESERVAIFKNSNFSDYVSIGRGIGHSVSNQPFISFETGDTDPTKTTIYRITNGYSALSNEYGFRLQNAAFISSYGVNDNQGFNIVGPAGGNFGNSGSQSVLGFAAHNNAIFNFTSGDVTFFDIGRQIDSFYTYFTPTSGSGNFTYAKIGGLNFQNFGGGTANGITRGLYINVTCNANTASYRALDIPNTASNDYAIYQSGSSDKNYFNGNSGYGTNSPLARIHIAGGTTTLAPRRISSGSLLSTISGNTIEYDGTSLYHTDNSVVRRYKIAEYLDASAVLDFPSTAANGISDLTITVSGASDGDTVSLGIPNAATTTGTFIAWVSATNTVTVRFHNTSGGSADPASGTFKVKVFK